jgi:hypothetical protein
VWVRSVSGPHRCGRFRAECYRIFSYAQPHLYLTGDPRQRPHGVFRRGAGLAVGSGAVVKIRCDQPTAVREIPDHHGLGAREMLVEVSRRKRAGRQRDPTHFEREHGAGLRPEREARYLRRRGSLDRRDDADGLDGGSRRRRGCASQARAARDEGETCCRKDPPTLTRTTPHRHRRRMMNEPSGSGLHPGYVGHR